MAKPDTTKIRELLTRGVEDVIVREQLQKRLEAGGKLRVKHGIDPTGPKIHLGRAISLWKLRAFQELGHQIVLIIGDFTAQVGDPSDKLSKRPFLTKEDVKKFLKGYLAQIGKIIDIKKAEVRYNSEWLKKLDFQDIAELAESFSAQQMLARRNFKERWEKQEEISLRELMYPLMQGYDSVAVKADVEIGGADQLFNLHAGRTIQEKYGQKPQDILTTKMLTGIDGRKMSSSWGNYIALTDEPNDMYGKVMSLEDALIGEYATLACPLMEESVVAAMQKNLESGSLSPRDIKMQLAQEIVQTYHGPKAAKEAEEEFVRVFQKKEAPSDSPAFLLSKLGNEFVITDLLTGTGAAASKSEAKRLVEQGGVTLNSISFVNPRETLKVEDIENGTILQVGKRHFFRLIKAK